MKGATKDYLNSAILFEDLKIAFLYLAIFVYPFSILLNNILFGAAFITLCIYLVLQGKTKINIRYNKLPYFILTLIFFKVLSDSLLSPNPDYIYIEKYFSFLFFPVFAFLNRNTSSRDTLLGRISYFIITSALLMSLICFYLHIRGFLINDIELSKIANWEFVSQKFTQPIGLHTTYAGIWALLAIILLYEKIFFLNAKAIKIFSIFSFLILFLFLIFISSRIILFCLVLYILIKYSNYTIAEFIKKSFLKAILSFLVIFLFSALVYKNVSVIKWRFKELSYNLSEKDYSKISYGGIKIRLIMWECALKEFYKKPIIGGNVNNTNSRLISCYKETGFEYGVEQNYSAHNQYLQTTLNFGIVGLLILIYYLIVVLKIFFKKNLAFKYLMIFFILIFLVENILSVQKGIVLWCFFVSFALNLDEKST